MYLLPDERDHTVGGGIAPHNEAKLMAAGRLHSALQLLLSSFQTSVDTVLTDGQLLDRFLHERDEAAFASLVQRHAAMVLAVARKVLHDTHDCEDVFQATFLVLAKKAAAIRRRRALGGWLYQVAFRLALKAKDDKTRRQIRERKVVEMAQTVDESRPVECDELREVLAQELSGLPEKYRAPMVLHYLEGRTKNETAHQLGWSSGTVSGRLARARKLLKSRLVKRGFTLSSSTFAAHLVQNNAVAVSKQLLDSAVRAGIASVQGLPLASSISATAIRLAGGMLQQMAATKFKLISLALLTVIVFGAGATAVLYDANARPAAQSQSAGSPKDAAAAPIQGKDRSELQRLSASGKVVDLQGKPIANAAVYFLEMASLRMTTQTTTSDYTDILAQAKSDKNGAFEFRDVRVEPMRIAPSNSYQHPWIVVAMAKGYAVAWHTFKADSEHDLVLTLTPEARIRGQLLDASSRPAAGVRVQVVEIDEWLNPDPRRRFFSGDELRLTLSRLPLSVVTNSDGWFVMDRLPKDLRVGLLIDDSRFARKWLSCATVDEATIERMNSVPNAREEWKLLKDGFTTTLEPTGTIRGQVVFGDTGKPAAGAKVRATVFNTVTDGEGRFTLKGFDTKKRDVYVEPPEDSDYLPATVDATVPADTRVRDLRISLERGSVVTGQLREKETGRSIRVPHVSVYFITAQERGTTQYPARGSTRADGSFRMAVRPGVGWISTNDSLPGYVHRIVRGDDREENTPDRFEVKAGETVTGKDVYFQCGLTASGKVLDPKGKPVAGTVFLGATPQAPSGADGSYTLRGLSLDQESHFLVVHTQRGLGAKLVIEPRKDQAHLNLDVSVQPAHSVQARVLDEQNQPVAKASVSLAANIFLWRRGNMSSYRPVSVFGPVSTDADGKFALPSFVINCGYTIRVSARGYAAAQTHLRVESDKPPFIPDITLLANKLTIAGIIVDQTGKPLEGIEAWILARNSTIALGPQSMRTDKEGRFCFSDLPKGEYRFIATLWKPTGESDKNGSPKKIAEVRKEIRVNAGEDKLRIELRVP
jgi:RNA polymerase sigma factor (sigma-70 family)